MQSDIPNESTKRPVEDALDEDEDSDVNKYQTDSILRRKPPPPPKLRTVETQHSKKKSASRKTKKRKRQPKITVAVEVPKEDETQEPEPEPEPSASGPDESPIEQADDGSVLSTWACASTNASLLHSARTSQHQELAAYRLRKPGIALAGCGWLRIIQGKAEILGSVLTEFSTSFFVVSAPIAPYAVTITPLYTDDDSTETDLNEEPSKDWLSEVTNQFDDNAPAGKLRCKVGECIVLFSPSRKIDLPNGLSHYILRAGIPACPDGPLLVTGLWLLDATPKLPCFVKWAAWNQMTTSLAHFLKCNTNAAQLRILVCGATGTGKSLLVRCTINHLLLTLGYKKVILVDTDVGQPEAALPGLISAHVVSCNRPGANAARNRDVPIAARFFGTITPRDDPTRYTNCVRNVISRAHQHALLVQAPIVVNSDGWINDTGADLLRVVAKATNPSHVVATRFPDIEQPAVVKQILQSVQPDTAHELDSPLKGRVMASAALLRDLAVAAYFAPPLEQGAVYELDLSAVCIITIGEMLSNNTAMRAAALNGCVVALGRDNGDEVVGCGLVRGIDLNRNAAFIATPIHPNVVHSCDCVVVCPGVHAPPPLFLATADKAYSHHSAAPYMQHSIIATGGRIKARANLNRR